MSRLIEHSEKAAPRRLKSARRIHYRHGLGTAEAVSLHDGVSTRQVVKWLVTATLAAIVGLTACRQLSDIDPSYHEFAYVSNGKSDSVSVIDTLALRNVKTCLLYTSPSPRDRG